ncbi:MAG: M1 family metallopeptidase [Caulobacterales bacterium]|nr:M1 family metallopeptidase [Caulobacterales bacterium]
MINRIGLGLALAGAVLLAGCGAGGKGEARHVLPTDITPIHYDIAVRPDAAALTFTGSVGADVEVGAATDTVTLNAADMTFGKVQLDGSNVTPTVAFDKDAQTATLTFDTPLTPGKHRLAIDYTGKINQQAFGLFSVDYDTPQGSKRLLATQFESPDARRFAPMWDEPALKATFKLTVDAPSADMVVSNTPVEKTEALEGGLIRTTFGATPKMSSYLLFLAVGDFERVSRKVGDVDVGVVVKRGSTGQAGFALDSAEQLLPWFNDYFGVPYPLPKLDMVALPGGAAAFSAMENWGAISYFEKAVLVDEAVSSESDRQGAFGTIAHEMAHQWFGDLVTMNWWDDIWLNEGFASWMANKATHVFHPEWSADLQTMAGRDGAMNLDARAATHPVVQPVADARDTAFDTISYQKGQAVINMVEAWVGEDHFRDALRAYMKKHAYGNTVSDDLWSAVEAASGQPIRQIAGDFTSQPGVPLIKVTSLGSAWRLAQRRFGVDAPSRKPLTWSTPVAATWPGLKRDWRGLVSMGQSVRIKGPADAPFLANYGQAGYFRTLYDDKAFGRLKTSFGTLAPADQLGLLYDYWAFGQEGTAPVARWLDLAANLPADANPVVWMQVTDVLGQIDRLYDANPDQTAWRGRARTLLAPVWARVGWTPVAGEPATTVLLRARLIEALGRFDDQTVVAEARARFARMDLPAAIREPTLTVVAMHADAATWDRLHDMARTSTNALEKQQLYSVLGETRDRALARRTLELALSDEPPTTLRQNILRGPSANFPAMTWTYLRANKTRADALFAPGSMVGMLQRITGGWADETIANDALAMARAEGEVPQRLKASLSAAVYRARVRRERLDEIGEWVKGG